MHSEQLLHKPDLQNPQNKGLEDLLHAARSMHFSIKDMDISFNKQNDEIPK